MGSSTLLNAKEYDPSKDRRRTIIIALVVVIGLAAIIGAWKGPEWIARWKADRLVEQFFAALQQQDFEHAYGLWIADPNWKQHPEKYPDYTYHQFYIDWGPGGDWGLIRRFNIEGSAIPEDHGGKSTSEVVVQVRVNDRLADKAQIWVNRQNHTLTEMPR
jgi:hypothetical protein